MVLLVLIIAFVFANMCSNFAESKGLNPIAWAIAGFFISILVWIMAIGGFFISIPFPIGLAFMPDYRKIKNSSTIYM